MDLPSAATLESVVKVEPVTSLVSESAALVVRSGRTTRNRGRKHRAAVERDIRGRGVRLGEVAVAEKTTREVLEVDVEGVVAALAEGLLHGSLGLVIVPGAVGGAGDALEDERDTGGGVVGVEDIELFRALAP